MKIGSIFVAALVCAAFAATAAGQGASSFAVPKRFRADVATNDVKLYPGSGLTRDFSRDIDTLDPLGQSVEENVMRFDRFVHIAAVPAELQVVPGALGLPAADGTILASGVGHTGQTLMLYAALNIHRLYFYENGILVHQRELGKPKLGPLSKGVYPDPPGPVGPPRPSSTCSRGRARRRWSRSPRSSSTARSSSRDLSGFGSWTPTCMS